MNALSDCVQKGSIKPPLMTIYGSATVGKTTFASRAPKPIFIMTEEGLVSEELINMPRLAAEGKELVESYDEVMHWLGRLLNDEHDFETLVFDSLSRFESLLHKKVCDEFDFDSIESPGFGRGYKEALPYWKKFMDMCIQLRNKRNMMIILIAHQTEIKVEPPDTEPYKKIAPHVDKHAVKLLIELMDCCFLMHKPVNVIKEDTGFGKQINRAVSDKSVYFLTQEEAWGFAKERYGLPSRIPCDWNVLIEHIAYLKQKISKQ